MIRVIVSYGIRLISSVVIAGLDPEIHLFLKDGSPGFGAEPVIGPAQVGRTRWRRPDDDDEVISRIPYQE